MKKLALAALLLACQKHDDTGPSTSTSTSTVATTSASASASATPLATIDPVTTASAAPSAATTDAGQSEAQRQRELALSKEAEQMQLQMLKVLMGSDAGAQGALNRNDIPPVDLATALSQLDAGATMGLGKGNVGGSTGSLRGPGTGGLSGIGARDH